MEDSSLFVQWAMDTLLHDHEHPEPQPPAVDDDRGEVAFPSLQALRDASHAAEMVRELMDAETHDAADSRTSSASGDGEITDGSSGGATDPAPAAATDYHGCSPWLQSPNNSFPRAPAPAPPSSSNNTNSNPPVVTTVSWNFATGSAQPGSDGSVLEETAPRISLPPPELVVAHQSPPRTRRPSYHPESMGAASSSASCTAHHIVAERKRREKINKRLIELSTVIPGLKKMDKATILTDAAKYVKELQQRLKALEEAAAGSNAAIRSKAPLPDENGSRSSSTSGAPAAALPEIEARFSGLEKRAKVRIHCGGGKGVAATALAEAEDLGLSIIQANVMPFSACTMIITITAKMEGCTVTTEQIVGRLKSALSHHQRSCCNDTENPQRSANVDISCKRVLLRIFLGDPTLHSYLAFM